MKTIVSICFATIVIGGCSNKDQVNDSENISGTYVRDYSFTVRNQETGAELGMRLVRDTIFVEPSGDQYQVSNQKWMMNDYDKDGWRNMEHMDDRPFSAYAAKFVDGESALVGEGAEKIYVDADTEGLSRDTEKKYRYVKLK